MGTVAAQSTSSAGGVEAAAKMINQVDRHTERNVFGALEENDAELAERIRSLLFVFEDIITLGDRELQMVIREADQSIMALALRGAPNELREKILSNMSERGAETLREELDLMPPKRRREVEEAQSEIVAIVRRLEEVGEITISRGGEEDELV
jgi:flagellar motor switch protein FliG